MRSNSRAALGFAVAVAWLLTACSPSVSGVPVFPIIGDDPEDLVSDMTWGASQEVDEIEADRPPISVRDSSTSRLIRIGVLGGSCPPTTQVRVTDDGASGDETEIQLVVGGSIEPEGVNCDETPTVHELIIEFREPIDLDGLDVIGRYTEGAQTSERRVVDRPPAWV